MAQPSRCLQVQGTKNVLPSSMYEEEIVIACIEITHHWFKQFFYDLLRMSQPCINDTGGEFSLYQDMQWFTQVLVAWFSSKFVLLEESLNQVCKSCVNCKEAERQDQLRKNTTMDIWNRVSRAQ
jgi:hypothetical protein